MSLATEEQKAERAAFEADVRRIVREELESLRPPAAAPPEKNEGVLDFSDCVKGCIIADPRHANGGPLAFCILPQDEAAKTYDGPRKSTHREALADQRSHAGEYSRDPSERHPVADPSYEVPAAEFLKMRARAETAEARARELARKLERLADYKSFEGCYRGGHSEPAALDAFRQGMWTVCNAAGRLLAEKPITPEPPTPPPSQGSVDRIYPCAHPGCTVMRTKEEGGTVFTVCDEHWDDKKGSGEAKVGEGDEDGAREMYLIRGGTRRWENLFPNEKRELEHDYRFAHSRGVAKGRAEDAERRRRARESAKQLAEYLERSHGAGVANVARAQALYHAGLIARSLEAMLSEEA